MERDVGDCHRSDGFMVNRDSESCPSHGRAPWTTGLRLFFPGVTLSASTACSDRAAWFSQSPETFRFASLAISADFATMGKSFLSSLPGWPMRTLLALLVLVTTTGWVGGQELLPPPKESVPQPGVAPPAVLVPAQPAVAPPVHVHPSPPLPVAGLGFYRRSAYEHWQYLSPRLDGEWRPRILTTPLGPVWAYDGSPYYWYNSNPHWFRGVAPFRAIEPNPVVARKASLETLPPGHSGSRLLTYNRDRSR